MPAFDPRAGALNLGAKYRVVTWTIVVTIECRQCDAHATVTLVNTQEAICPSCGATHALGGMRWDVTAPTLQTPQFGIASSAPADRERPVLATH